MRPKYEHLLQPIKIRNVVLKNRMISGNALPHFLQGPENFPNEQVIQHVVNCAKNGAAVVAYADWTNMKQRESFNEDGKRFPMYDLDHDVSIENYLSQMANQVHAYNSKISLAVMPFDCPEPGYEINEEPAIDLSQIRPDSFREDMEKLGVEITMGQLSRGGTAAKQMPTEMVYRLAKQLAERAHKYQTFGFDMVTYHMAYRATLASRFMSPITNHRTDEFGGSAVNRGRFMKEVAKATKELCGNDFLVEIQITPEEYEPNGNKLEDIIEMAKACEDYVDIFQLRAADGNLNHPTGYNSTEHVYYCMEAARKMKAAGVKQVLAPIGGFQDPQDIDDAIARGDMDMMAAARAFFVDNDYYQKILEGRGEDVVPCIRCNKCHVPSLKGEWVSICSVNPRLGINHKVDKMVTPTGNKKNVGIVGGGPAGLRAAIFAAEAGHTVTIYEKSDKLGGQINYMDDMKFKWPLVRYREWLISQVKKLGVTVKLNTNVTPGSLDDKHDVVLLALGAMPKKPPVKGVENAVGIFDTLGQEKKLGHKVVVVGGSESGTETGMYLADAGHDVTVLTRSRDLAEDATPIHYREMMDEYYRANANFHYVTKATTVEIGKDFVIYKDKDGNEQKIACDSVVALGGMYGQSDEALTLYNMAPETYMIGDVLGAGNLAKCNRSAFIVTGNL